MKYSDRDEHLLSLQAAAQRAGLPTSLVTGSYQALAQRQWPWLRLALGSKTYFYARGILLEASGAVGGALGRPVNGRAVALVRDKQATKALLASAGIAVPRGRLYGRDGLQDALRDAPGIGATLCAKPNTGSQGRAVFPRLRGAAALQDAFRRVAEVATEILVEESVEGEDIRFFYVAPRVVAVKLGRRAAVTGDGVASIRALLEAKNAERRRRAVVAHGPIAIDAELEEMLAEQGLTLDSRLPAGAQAMLGRLFNSNALGETIACPPIHPGYAAVAEAACHAVPDLRLAALDFKIAALAAAPAPGNHWLLEINSAPSLIAFHHPWEGPVQDVSAALIDLLQREAAGA